MPNVTLRPKERTPCPIKCFVRSPPGAPSCFAPAITCVVRAGRSSAHARCVSHVPLPRAQPARRLTSGGSFRRGLWATVERQDECLLAPQEWNPPVARRLPGTEGGQGAREHELGSTRSAAMGGSTRGPGALEGDDVLGQVRAGTWRWPEEMSQAAPTSEACGFLSTSLPMSD